MTPAARAGELLAYAETELAAGRIAEASEAIYGVANELAATGSDQVDEPVLLGRALWLIAVISLLKGELDVFAQQAAAAIETFELAEDPEVAEAARATLAEITTRITNELVVSELGASGFLDALARSGQRLLMRWRGELDWDAIDRDRQQLAELLASAQAPPPLLRLVRAFELDLVEVTILSLLIPLASDPELSAGVGHLEGGDAGPGISAHWLAELLFAVPAAKAAVLTCLAPGGALQRYRLIRTGGGASPQHVWLDPDLLWFLRDAPSVDWPWPPGVSVEGMPSGHAVVPWLEPVRDGLARLFDQPAGAVTVLVATPGSGKTTITVAAASSVGRPTIVLDADGSAGETHPTSVAVAIRNAFLLGAAVYVRCECRLPDLGRWLEEPALRLVLGTTRSLFPELLAAVRRVRADVAGIELAPLPLEAQAREWRRACIELGCAAPVAAETLCRSGLCIGDIVDTATEARIVAATEGREVSDELLGRVLDARLLARLGEFAPVVLPQEVASDGVAAEFAALASRMSVAVTEVLDWGAIASAPTRRGTVAVRLTGVDARRRREWARGLAAHARVPLAILSLEAGANPALLISALEAAARAAALLLVDDAGGLTGELTDILMTELGRTPGTVVVSAEQSVARRLASLEHVHLSFDPGDRA